MHLYRYYVEAPQLVVYDPPDFLFPMYKSVKKEALYLAEMVYVEKKTYRKLPIQNNGLLLRNYEFCFYLVLKEFDSSVCLLVKFPSV